MLQVPLLCLLATASHALASSFALAFREDFFFKCTALPATGSHLAAWRVRSELECAHLCSSTDGCGSVHVQTDVNHHMVCSLRDDSPLPNCPSVTSGGQHIGDYFVRKVCLPEGELVCRNDGELQNGECVCPLPFTGVTCDRYIRDCTEAFELGHVHTYSEPLLIQPLSSASPFWVKCHLQWGGATYVMLRTRITSWNTTSWSQIKTGFGDDLGVVSGPQNYFIGLEKMREILGQAEYQAHFFSMYNQWTSQANAFYTNFTMGPESDDYGIHYDSFFCDHGTADNAMDGELPKKFCTYDHDGMGCGQLGWYGSDCKGFGLLEYPLTWPVGGTAKQLNFFELNLVRKSPFYEN